METIDEVKRYVWHNAYDEYRHLKKENSRNPSHPKDDDSTISIVKAAKAKADFIKWFTYALGKALEHLTESQQNRVNVIVSQHKQLCRAYMLKEQLRVLLKIKDVKESELKH